MKTKNLSNSKIEQIKIIEQNLKNYNLQEQGLMTRNLEIDSALEELSLTSDSYKIVGNIMVKMDSSKLNLFLTEEKQKNNFRIKTIQKQIISLEENYKNMQQEVMKELQEH
jgi:chaperonin cofactor prefoldin